MNPRATPAPRTAAWRLAARRGMRGAMAVMGVMWLSVAVICLMAIDIGHVFWQQREVQKIADLSAMAGAAGQFAECQSHALAGARRNGLRLDAELQRVQCGNWDPKQSVAEAGSSTDRPDQFFVESREPFNAARVTVRRTVPYFFVFGGDESRALTATATAARATPLAVLNIRSTAADFDTSRSPLLNAVIGGLLGGSVNLTAASWQGLVNTDIDLLSYLDALAVELGVRVGDYEQLLQTSTDVGTLLRVAANVLQRSGNTATATVDAINGLLGVQAAVPAGAPLLQLAELLHVQSGSSLSGLDVGLQAMQLVQGVVQAANGKNALVADVPANLLGLVNARVSVKVIEPPQISAVGDPEQARLAPSGPNQIFVRTAQVRTLVSVDLPALSGVSGLLNTVTAALAPVTNVLNNLLSLNLVGLVDSILCVVACERTLTDIAVLPPPVRLDLSIEAGNGQSRLTDYSCDANSRSLTTSTRTALGDVRIGRMGSSALDAKARVFATRDLPVVDPVPVLDVGSKRCFVALGILGSCAARTPYVGGGLGISGHIPVAARDVTQVFNNPPRLDEPPRYQAIATEGIVGSLEDTARGLNVLKPIAPASVAEGAGLGNLLTQLTTALSGVINALGNVVRNVLSPLLDPLVDSLLKALGVDLAQTEVAGRLSCSANVELVY